MKKIIFCLIFGFPSIINAQQQSEISIDSGNKNKIVVTQSEGDSVQRSLVRLKKADSSDIHVEQSGKNPLPVHEEPSLFMRIVHNTYYLSETIVALGLIIGFLIRFFVNRNKKKKK